MNPKRFLHYLTIREHRKSGKWWHCGLRATIVTTTRCPFGCDYCPMFIYGAVKKYEDSSFEDWKSWLDRFPYWVSHYYVSGGEPSLYKDIVPLVNHLIERGHHVTIFTNLWKVENFRGIKPHWRLLFQPTFHKGEDDLERFVSAQKKLEKMHLVRSQQIFERSEGINRIKEFFTTDWFKEEDNTLHFAPDTPKSLKIYSGCAELYRKEKR